MRKYICVWCILLAFSSCSTTKDFEHLEDKSYHFYADSVRSEKQQSWAKAWIEEMISENIINMSWEKLTIYDTSLPIDENTGKAPILVEYERKDSAKIERESFVFDSISSVHSTVVNDSSHVEQFDTAHVYTHEHKESKSTVGHDAIRIAMLIGLVIVCIGILFIQKIMDKYGL